MLYSSRCLECPLHSHVYLEIFNSKFETLLKKSTAWWSHFGSCGSSSPTTNLGRYTFSLLPNTSSLWQSFCTCTWPAYCACYMTLLFWLPQGKISISPTFTNLPPGTQRILDNYEADEDRQHFRQQRKKGKALRRCLVSLSMFQASIKVGSEYSLKAGHGKKKKGTWWQDTDFLSILDQGLGELRETDHLGKYATAQGSWVGVPTRL